MSTTTTDLTGTIFFPVMSKEPVDDPWQRPYLRAPKCTFGKPVAMSFPLKDVRPLLFGNATNGANWDAEDKSPGSVFLSKHGFTFVKHKSSLLSGELEHGAFDSTERMVETYYPEIEELVKQVTGAKKVFVENSFIRQSQPSIANQSNGGDKKPVPKRQSSSAERGLPKSIPAESKIYNDSKTVTDQVAASIKSTGFKTDPTIHVPSSQGVPPARPPHLDYTALGARQAIRSWRLDITQAASEGGVIEAEDRICQGRHVKATEENSNEIIAENYNRGTPGPRYAAFSVWRPLRKVQRDPLAMLPRKDLDKHANTGLVFWPYYIRAPGHPELGGDFLRELVQLRAATDPLDKIENLHWYYLSEQQPDEVAIVKFFDSAALGDNAQEADGPYHCSPYIGDVGEERHSIEVRVFAFW